MTGHEWDFDYFRRKEAKLKNVTSKTRREVLVVRRSFHFSLEPATSFLATSEQNEQNTRPEERPCIRVTPLLFLIGTTYLMGTPKFCLLGTISTLLVGELEGTGGSLGPEAYSYPPPNST